MLEERGSYGAGAQEVGGWGQSVEATYHRGQVPAPSLVARTPSTRLQSLVLCPPQGGRDRALQ